MEKLSASVPKIPQTTTMLVKSSSRKRCWHLCCEVLAMRLNPTRRECFWRSKPSGSWSTCGGEGYMWGEGEYCLKDGEAREMQTKRLGNGWHSNLCVFKRYDQVHYDLKCFGTQKPTLNPTWSKSNELERIWVASVLSSRLAFYHPLSGSIF